MKRTAGMIAAVFLLAITTGCGVKQIRDQVTVEAGQELALLGEDFFEASGKDLEKISFDLTQVNINQVGSYPVTAALGRKKYDITVHVADRTPPMVELSGRVVFTGDLAEYDPMQLIEGIYDASAYSVALVRYAREADLGEIADLGWESMEALLLEPVSQEELKSLGTAGIPREEGIYRGVLEVADIYDNVWLEQLWIVLEKQETEEIKALAAKIGALAAGEIGAPAAGEVGAPAAGANADDAGQVSFASVSDSGEDLPSGREGETGGSGRPEDDPTYYDTHLEEGQLAAINAGYYKVVPDPRYGGYIVMVHGGEGTRGTGLIREYLASIGCVAVGGSGDWISIDDDQYAVYVTADEIRPAEEGEISDWGELIRE